MNKLIILFVFILTSCGIEYDGETKLVVKGKVVDENNIPIANKEVNLFVSNESYKTSIGYSTDCIGITKTNNEGVYTMVFPKPKNFGEIYVDINKNDNLYNNKQFRNIQNHNFNAYQLHLPTSILYQKNTLALLNIFLNQTNISHQLKNIELIGLVPNEIEFLNPPTHFASYMERFVKKNQNLILRYTVFNHSTNQTTILDQNIIIDNSNIINFTLNY